MLNTNNINFLIICQLIPLSNIFFFYKNYSLNLKELLVLNCFLSVEYLKFFLLHVRLSFFFYLIQSIELLSYTVLNVESNVLLYIYYNLFSHKYYKLYTLLHNNKLCLYSVENIYYNFWWLEREVSEMSGVSFIYKFDTRNLLLEYFSIFKPLKKQFPSYGLTEIYYNLIYFFSVQPLISLQN